MKKNILLLPFICFLFICCNTITGPFEGVNFGNISKKTFLNEMINNGTFQVYKEDAEKINDTSSIGFILKKDDKEFPMRVYLNEEFYKGDEFNFGSLRRMEFRIGENTTEYGRIYRNSGKVSKKFVDNLYQTYIDLYGKPDTLKQVFKVGYKDVEEDEYVKNKQKNDSYVKSTSSNKKKDYESYFESRTPSKIDIDYLNGKKAVWVKDNFILTFSIPPIKKTKTPNEKAYYQKDSDKPILIVYEMKSYKEELIRLKDSIAKNLNPDDIIHFNIASSKFTNSNQFLIELSGVSLKSISKADFLTDKISGFKYSLIVKDYQDNIIFSNDNLDYELELKLGNNGNGVVTDRETYLLYKEISINTNGIPDYTNKNFKVTTIIKELRLEDGRIIRKN